MWCGVVCCGMVVVWCGAVWCGVVWCGVLASVLRGHVGRLARGCGRNQGSSLLDTPL